MIPRFPYVFIFYWVLIFLLIGIVALPPVFTYLFWLGDSIEPLSIRITLYLISTISFVSAASIWIKRETLSSNTTVGSIANLSLFSISVILGLIIGELLLRTFYPVPNGIPNQNHLFRPDSTYGWTFIPNISARVNWRYESQVDVTINSSGFRDKEFQEQQHVAVLGDSFVAGLEVEHENNFTELLEKELGISVRNYGLNGYGPTQNLIQLRDKVLHDNTKMVIFQLYLRNDFHDISGAYKWISELRRPKAIISGDSLKKILPAKNIPEVDVEYWRSYFQPDVRKPIRPHHFHIYNLITRTKEVISDRWLKSPENANQPPERKLLSSETDSLFQKAFFDSRIILREMKNITHRKSIPFLVTLAPSFVQVNDQAWNQFISDYPQKSPDREKLSRLIKKWGEKDGYPVLDLLPALRKASKEKTLYFPINQHWTPAGHKIVTEELVYMISSIRD